MLMGYSKNQKAAKDFLRWITSKEIYDQWFNSQQGYSVGATTMWEKDPVWKKRSGDAAVPHPRRAPGASPATPARPTARPPKV